MTMRTATWSLPAALMLTLALGPWACGGGHGEEGCPELCEQVAACGDATTTAEQCLTECEAETEVAEEKGCTDYRTEYLECAGHADAVCDPDELEDECKIQSDAYATCMGDST